MERVVQVAPQGNSTVGLAGSEKTVLLERMRDDRRTESAFHYHPGEGFPKEVSAPHFDPQLRESPLKAVAALGRRRPLANRDLRRIGRFRQGPENEISGHLRWLCF